MTPPPDLSEVSTPDLSEVSTRDLIAMLRLALARYQARRRVESRLVGLSREPIR